MNDTKLNAVCFGEILWDILPAGTLPGGAPMNVAYHLHLLGDAPGLITRIGTDERGKELRNILEGRQIDTALLQVDGLHPTGIVYGTADRNGDMKYEIVAPSAWDFIDANDDCIERTRSSKYFIFGSLAARNPVSRQALFQLLDAANTSVLDVNLRSPFFDRSLIGSLLKKADIIKLNSDELKLLAGWWGITGSPEKQLNWLQKTYDAETIIVTRGAQGAAVLHENILYEHPGFTVTVVDTVGSGDAFLAGFLHYRLQGRHINDCLTFACKLGSFVATRSGAWPSFDAGEIAAMSF